jgi:cytochrome c-type biogenesis protein CcmH
MNSRRALTLLAACVALGPALAGPPAASAAVELTDIEDEVMCPICGTALELAQAPQAERQRAFIRGLIARGRSKEQIKDALVAEYGPEVLAVPESEGFDLAAWLVPAAALLAALAAIGVAFRRWRSRPAPPPQPDISPAEAERLDADLARHDL